MFNPSRADARNFFFDLWLKHRTGATLTALERLALGWVLQHPEYHALLDERERHLERTWHPQQGETNPFLHLAMHLSLEEQLSIDQPAGVRDAHERLLQALGDEHATQHAMMDCLAEMIWRAQREGTALDPSVYLDCLENRTPARSGRD